MMRKSQAFAAFRQSLVSEGLLKVNEFVPAFNAEAEDIRQEFENTRAYSEALALDRKRARTMDLVVRRNEFIQTLQTWFRVEQHERLMEYGAEVQEDGRAHFPDNTTAKVSKGLWIDYKQFQRI